MPNFREQFAVLTGFEPFPWQCELYERFLTGQLPSSCNIPTGLGKTAVIAIWLLALAKVPDKIWRRLVYVVNRRTVVDQTTVEVEKLRENAPAAGLLEPLRKLCALPLNDGDSPLAISTLRGQFADNRAWSADPARPAVICGTVDMIGSRLLFSGYNVGFRAKPLHAGFLGQDALLVHDEAHLEPAFQELLKAVVAEQARERNRAGELPWRALRVMELSATSRQDRSSDLDGEPFELTAEEKKPPRKIPDPPQEPIHTVWRRLKAHKTIHLVQLGDFKKGLPDKIVELATEKRFVEANQAVLIYARTIEHVKKIVEKLKKKVGAENVEQLTGTLRGLERQKLPAKPVFARFLPASSRPTGAVVADDRTVYLVCTSAGEVGVNLSADHLICDLTTFESMAQRFGRVNRFGDHRDSEIHVVHPEKFEESDYEQSCKRTLALLQQLDGDASPLALMRLDATARSAAFTLLPKMLPATDILFDAWSLTTIHEKLPGRPPVEAYLHGIAEWEAPETYVAWRKEAELIHGSLLEEYLPEELLGDYPLKPHELLRDQTERILKELAALAERHIGTQVPAWVLSDAAVEVTDVSSILGRDPDELRDCTILLPPSAGGLTEQGALDGNAERDDLDVADQWQDEDHGLRRRRFLSHSRQVPVPEGMRPVRAPMDLKPDSDEFDSDEGDLQGDRYWHWFVRPRSADDDGSKIAQHPVPWHTHTDQVTDYTDAIAMSLALPEELQATLHLAAKLHDSGKKRQSWQRSIGNPNPQDWYAKSGKGWRPIDLGVYRHELGSLLDAEQLKEVNSLPEDMRDLILHLIAAHHGRGRPHFSADELIDPERGQRAAMAAAAEAPRRFARLQRKYGRWGLAYLESLLRAADWAASSNPRLGDGARTAKEAVA